MASMNRKKLVLRVLFALLLGSIMTGLTYFVVREEKEVGPSCEICMDFSSGYVWRGLPFVYYELETTVSGKESIRIGPDSVVANTILWGLLSFAVLNLLPKLTKKRAKL